MSDEPIALVKPQWRDAFRRFMEAGELDPDFEAYLNTDPDAQHAVDQAFEAQAGSLSTLLREASAVELPPELTVRGRAERAAAVLKAGLDLPPHEQESFFARFTSALKEQTTESQQRALAATIDRALQDI